ncbi:hypothetical protein [Clostridium fungisolvens]|uniref:Single-stranded DNA-binding protein n=1 Tax=Clostridium fungisolvens TaxID=1604897 RepID=A0A6V8SPT0_9CLOT|nr:hypothetical protein [Clostridium fungisolvens]GFP78562.1 hypothetical protein bsdtw1_04799 [Clostridium fungisolvens]
MRFNTRMMLTGIKQGTNNKTGQPYILITALDKEEGKTMDFLYKGTTPLDFTKYVAFQDYEFEIQVFHGKYLNLNVVDIRQAK